MAPRVRESIGLEAQRALDAVARRRIEALFREHAPMLLLLARKLCRGDAEAWDLLMETFEYAARNSAKPWPGYERGWLRIVLEHRFYDRYASRVLTPIDEGELARYERDLSDAKSPLAQEEAVWMGYTYAHIVNAADQLPEGEENYRSLFRMKYFERRSMKFLAEFYQVPMGTVGTRLRKARQLIKVRLLRLPSA